MANWVIGYFGTGKPWVSIPQPGAQSSFDQSMTSDKVTLHLASGFESHQAAVNVLSKALDYRYYIARLEDDLRVSSAGIVNRLEVDESGWSISGEDFESYLSRRVIIDPRDWAAEALERQPVYNYSGTWRQIVWQAVVDIISRTSNRIKPPVRLLGSLTEGRERKTETVEAIDLVSMGEFINKIQGKENEMDLGAGLVRFADHGQRRFGHAPAVALVMAQASPADGHFQVFGQGVDHGDAYVVQAA